MYDAYVRILENELIPATGCTEPIAIAYAAAVARRTLGCVPETVAVQCSGNILKNAMGVLVPYSGGMHGVDVAAMLGAVGGDADKRLSVLEAVTPENIAQTRRLLAEGRCRCMPVESPNLLYIHITVQGGGHSAAVEIIGSHVNITRIMRDGGPQPVPTASPACTDVPTEEQNDTELTIREILDFAGHVDIGRIRGPIERQIACNMAIAEEGIRGDYGQSVGKTILESKANPDIDVIAIAMATAGSDARMNGCEMPVIINSGSGNQGITASVPVICYARHYGIGQDKLIRALAVSNLIAIHQKRYIGNLSAFCGAVNAACGSACGIACLFDGSYAQISMIITNTIATIGGMVCDGAKSSCAAKIAAALDTARTAYEMSRKNRVFHAGEGLVKGDAEHTIQSIGRMAREGMRTTDQEILHIMTEP